MRVGTDMPTAGANDSRWTPAASAAAPAPRSAVLAVADAPLRAAITRELRLLRWTVREAAGAAEMFALLEAASAAAVVLDGWLPDLDFGECVDELQIHFPALPLLSTDGTGLAGTGLAAAAPKGHLRSELLHALRQAQGSMDAPVWNGSASSEQILRESARAGSRESAPEQAVEQTRKCAPAGQRGRQGTPVPPDPPTAQGGAVAHDLARRAALEDAAGHGLPEFVGAGMLEVSRRIRLVAHRKTAVLVHGETGTGKELVARALHRLSGRPAEKFVAINCAAIPEALVESELFGYARGAFTGAVQSRIGRIEAASGGTLFLDEIGELPLTVQSKLLRFLESGEIQRVGENETVHVDARVVAATHRKLGAMAAAGSFRVDLLHRLSVFLIQTPPLAGRHHDIDALIDHALRALASDEAPKQLSAAARAKLHAHSWPGNVRELEHTLERAWILAGESAVIDEPSVDFGEALL